MDRSRRPLRRKLRGAETRRTIAVVCLLLAKLFMEAGARRGVLNVVNGFGAEAGKALALHHDVEKIALTGSVEIGKLMMVYSGQSNLKKVSTECGGKSPHVIMADADNLETAAWWAAMGIFGNQGEVCCAGSRILVQKSILPDFLDAFSAVAKKDYIPGDPLETTTTVGPMVTVEQQQRVLNYIGIGKQGGADCILGGGVPEGLEAGAYVSPTIFTGVTNSMTIAREEIFGPVASIIPFDSYEEAVTIANDSNFGLGGWDLDQQPGHGASLRTRCRGRHGLHQQLHEWGHAVSVRRLEGKRQRSRQMHGCPRLVHPDQERLGDDRQLSEPQGIQTVKTGWNFHELYLWHDTGNAAQFFPAGLTIEPANTLRMPQPSAGFAISWKSPASPITW